MAPKKDRQSSIKSRFSRASCFLVASLSSQPLKVWRAVERARAQSTHTDTDKNSCDDADEEESDSALLSKIEVWGNARRLRSRRPVNLLDVGFNPSFKRLRSYLFKNVWACSETYWTQQKWSLLDRV